MRAEAVRALALLELKRRMRDRYTWAGLLALAAVVAIGAYFHWQSLPPRPPGGRLFGEAYVLGLAIAFHCSIAVDRQCRFDRFMSVNFASPPFLYAVKLLSTLVFLVVYAGAAFLMALAWSLGDLAYAADYTARLFAASMLMLPLVVLVELVAGTRTPVPILIIVFFAVLAVYARSHDVQPLVHVLGMSGRVQPVPFLLRSAAAVVLCALLFPLFARPLRTRVTRRASRRAVVCDHGPIDSGRPAALSRADPH